MRQPSRFASRDQTRRIHPDLVMARNAATEGLETAFKVKAISLFVKAFP